MDDNSAEQELAIWSASLPAIFNFSARPWNGRELTDYEKDMACKAYAIGGPQAALEWLSEYA